MSMQPPDLKTLHAKINEQTLERALSESALTKVGLLSAKRCSIRSNTSPHRAAMPGIRAGLLYGLLKQTAL